MKKGRTDDVDVSDVEYATHGNRVLMARLFRPRAVAPTAAVVDVHGGAWTTGDRHGNEAISVRLAAAGVFVMAIDYRVPPHGLYPASVQDVNVAVRWLKASAARYGVDPERIGILGTSSGGHLAVLAALKPADPRYVGANPELGADARVPFVVALWPVICPYTRFRDVVLGGTVDVQDGDRAGMDPRQMDYWRTEEAMAEGSPLFALARGDAIDRPAILYLQNPADRMHPLKTAEAFVDAYRAAGGAIALHLFHGARYNLVRTDPDGDEGRAALARIVAFIDAPERRLDRSAT